MAAAQAGARFRVVLPSEGVLDPTSLRGAYLFPAGSAVALQFPLVTASAIPVRQEPLEIWEGPWTFDEKPIEVFREDVEADPISTALIRIDGVDVLTVKAHSPAEDEQANPSFLRFEMDGLDIQISGGDHLDDLLDIARSMITGHGAAD